MANSGPGLPQTASHVLRHHADFLHAAAAGVSRWTLRRRLVALAQQHPGLLRSYAPPGHAVGKWLVNTALLKRALRGETESAESAGIGSTRSIGRVKALHESHVRLKAAA